MGEQAHVLSEADAGLAELVRQARAEGHEIVLADDDGPVAAIVPIDVLRDLQAARDAADIAICEASKANPGRSMTHDEFMATLAAEDAAAE